MKKDDKAPRKKLSLNFGTEGKLPTQLQEKLQHIKALYKKAPSENMAPVKEEVKKEMIVALNPEAEKKAKAIQHEKDQHALKKHAYRQRLEKKKQALDWLCEQYPLCFSKGEPKPLKRRVEKDVLAGIPSDLPFSRLNIREAIAYYVSSPKYRKALITATHRYDLQGHPGEEVTIEQQEFAQTKFAEYAERKKKFEIEKKGRLKANNEKQDPSSKNK